MSEQPAVPSSPTDGPDSRADGAPVFAPYNPPAGGWGALRATARALREQSVELKGSRALLSMNQPDGFDCPGCAWPDPRHTSSFEFCENGAKAVTWELTKRRVTREFFAAHTVRELEQESDYWLEEQGRLTEPMRYDPATDHYVPVSWDEAFALVGRELNALDDPNEAEFYTSGRTSNEAAFMYQLFARRFGTNNFPDCSNMCHEPTSVGLPESIGIGKGTVLLDDFAYAEAIFILGQNPGTNSPRMLTELHAASRRNVPIVVFNPLRERALERFAAPQDPVEMATFGETRIASEYCQVRIGGDIAALKGVMKLVLEAHDEALRNDAEPVLDLDFIANHTHGFEAFANDLRQTRWEDILRVSGLPRDQLERVAAVYMRSRAVIVVYGMGITQHRLGTANVQQIVNLIAPWASTRSQSRYYWISSRKRLASSRRAHMVTMSSTPYRRWWMGALGCSSDMAAISSGPCRIGRWPRQRCAGCASPSASTPSSTGAIWFTAKRRLSSPVWREAISTCRLADGNQSPSRTACRWCMHHSGSSSRQAST
jgi:anaerobic selenocysteine-containing dehydrogenase